MLYQFLLQSLTSVPEVTTVIRGQNARMAYSTIHATVTKAFRYYGITKCTSVHSNLKVQHQVLPKIGFMKFTIHVYPVTLILCLRILTILFGLGKWNSL